jgi:hypothetical protein
LLRVFYNRVTSNFQYARDNLISGYYASADMKQYGVSTEADYPYQARVRRTQYLYQSETLSSVQNEPCRLGFAAPKSAQPSYVRIEPGSEADLMDAVANMGPVAVGVDAQHNFKHYREG